MIVTVTLNAALDRTLLVPNFQPGQRHRASVGFASAGGKGLNVARALRRLGVPVVCTGLVGGESGTQIADDLGASGILNDFVRIREDSRTSVAVLDPISDQYTEINEWGPEVGEDELDALREKLAYLTQGAEFVVLAGTLPRGVDPDFYAETIRELNRGQVLTVLDSEGEALRLATRAEPTVVTPNELEAEGLVGHEFADDEDRTVAMREILELGAREAVMTMSSGCLALVEDREAPGQGPRLYRVRLEPVDTPVSAVGSGDAFLAGYVAARYSGSGPEEGLRFAVACGAESTQHFGAGVLDARAAERLTGDVEVEMLPDAAVESRA